MKAVVVLCYFGVIQTDLSPKKKKKKHRKVTSRNANVSVAVRVVHFSHFIDRRVCFLFRFDANRLFQQFGKEPPSVFFHFLLHWF